MESTFALDGKTFPGFTYESSSGGVSSFRMDANGLQVLLMPQYLAAVATFMITYRVGSGHERLGETGATHFLEHMMFKGTPSFNREKGTSIFNVLQQVGARVNATTWNDRTNYYELIPARHLDLAIQIEADRMRGALLSPEDVASEKTVILNEFDRGENEPMRKLYHAVWSTAYEAHPYHHPTIGWRSDIENATPESLRSFYDRYYWPNNATVSVIGGFDPDPVMASIHEQFSSIPSAPGEMPTLNVREPRQRGERRTTIRMAGGQRSVLVAHKSPPGLEKQTMALHLCSMILSHGKTSRLYQLLIESGKATGQSSSASSFRDPGLFVTVAMLAPDSTSTEIESIILDAYQELANKPVSESELARALAKLEATTYYARDGSFSVASELNEAIAAGDWKLYTEFLDRARSVTTEDIQEAASQVFQESSRTIGLYEPEEES